MRIHNWNVARVQDNSRMIQVGDIIYFILDDGIEREGIVKKCYLSDGLGHIPRQEDDYEYEVEEIRDHTDE